jgi:alpha-L-arabinofuranosidase
MTRRRDNNHGGFNIVVMATPLFVVRSDVVARVDDRLFGQFLERPSWGGEQGPERALMPGTNQLLPAVVTMMKKMQIPILRFPGGTDVDYTDWRDMVSNVPGRAGVRPVTVGHKGDRVTNGFGFDEYFRLRNELGCETILVVNLLDALSRKRPLAEAAELAAGLVAYCNAPVGAMLPAGMPDWPAVRARNGHPAPYRVGYFQIGNEWWAFGNRATNDAAWWIVFVHFRDVRGTAERFEETFHDDGPTDMPAMLKLYHEVGFTGPIRVDHVPTLAGEDNAQPGYGKLGRLFALGYLKGILQTWKIPYE